MTQRVENKRDMSIQAVEAFLSGLVESDVERMPFAPDVVLASPLDPGHPAVGKEAVVQFLETRVFPRIPVHDAQVERHIVEGEYVVTLWKAMFKSPENGDVFVRICDFFRVVDGLIKEVRPYFDPQALKQILRQAA